jgi:fluoride exporter
MSAPVLLAVGLAGGLGAIARFLLDGTVSGRVGVALDKDAYRVAGTGLIGAFTTFSTWSFESHRLGEDGDLDLGLLNFAVSLVLGLIAAWAGQRLGASP